MILVAFSAYLASLAHVISSLPGWVAHPLTPAPLGEAMSSGFAIGVSVVGTALLGFMIYDAGVRKD